MSFVKFSQFHNRLTATIILTSLVSMSQGQSSSSHLMPPADPFTDPSNDVSNPLRYIASNTLTAVAFSLYMAVALFMTFATWKWGARYMLPMVIGTYTFSMGIAFRFGLHTHPDSKGTYITEYLLVVLSPCAFIAADYILLSRVVRHLDAGQYLLIRPERVTKTFVLSDISTFLIQAIGGSIAASANDTKHNNIGSRIFLAGLVIQLLSFSIFTVIFLVWLYRVRIKRPELWLRSDGWKVLILAETLSCVGIIIRSIYRVAELSQGFHGHLATTESLFYALDTYPLFVAVVVYVPFWPGRIMSDAKSVPEESGLSDVVGAAEKEHTYPPLQHQPKEEVGLAE